MPRSRVPALGSRGEGWVALQAVALAAVVVAAMSGDGWPARVARPLDIIGLAVLVAGAVLVGAGARALGPSLTPLPAPRAGGGLRTGGIYARARHPVYGGVLLLALGSSLATAPLALVPTALLGVVFALKSRREEMLLVDVHPGYEDYRRRTPRRFVPWIL